VGTTLPLAADRFFSKFAIQHAPFLLTLKSDNMGLTLVQIGFLAELASNFFEACCRSFSV